MFTLGIGLRMMTKWTKKYLCQHFAFVESQPFWASSSTECLRSLSSENQIDTYRERELFSIILTTTTTSLGDLWRHTCAYFVSTLVHFTFRVIIFKDRVTKVFWWPFVDRNTHWKHLCDTITIQLTTEYSNQKQTQNPPLVSSSAQSIFIDKIYRILVTLRPIFKSDC